VVQEYALLHSRLILGSKLIEPADGPMETHPARSRHANCWRA